MTIKLYDWAIIEYLGPPYTPAARRVFDPIGDGPFILRQTSLDDAMAFIDSCGGAPGPFRAIEIHAAVKLGLVSRELIQNEP